MTSLPQSEGGASGLLVDIYLWTAWKVRARAVLPYCGEAAGLGEGREPTV